MLVCTFLLSSMCWAESALTVTNIATYVVTYIILLLYCCMSFYIIVYIYTYMCICSSVYSTYCAPIQCAVCVVGEMNVALLCVSIVCSIYVCMYVCMYVVVCMYVLCMQ